MMLNNTKHNVRAYKLASGDVFSISENQAFEVMSRNSYGYMFIPIKRYRRVVWYKPSTWFRWLWQIECRLID